MDKISLIGTIAAICTTGSFVPQAIKIYRTKHTKDLSLPMYLVFTAGVLLWMYYGMMINSGPVIAANVVTFLLCLYILFMKLKYK